MESRTNVSKDGEISHVNFQENVSCTSDGSRTLLELFLNRCEAAENDDFLGTIVNNDQVKYKSFGEIRRLVERLSGFLNGLVEPKSMIGIYSVNRYEWIVAEMAIYMSDCTNVPLYSTFSPSAIGLVLNETEMKVCIASSDKARSLLENVLRGNENNFISHIILMDDDAGLISRFNGVGINAYYLGDVIKKASKTRSAYPTGEDMATICYTSGTSGNPKGVMLSHKNFISSVAATFRGSTENEMIRITKEYTYLSYLPLAHVMERICVAVGMASGCRIGFYRGNSKTIQADYLAIKPTFIAAVPRVLNLFKEKIETQVQKKNFILRGIFNLALKYKIWRQKSGVFKSRFLDWLIFNKVSAEFGGNIREILCGSASLKPEVLKYLQATLSCHIFQGYGQTEGVGANILKPLDYYEYDNVGIPFPSNKIKLKRVAGYDEYSGEILLKGDNITSGYYKRPEQTEELFTEDGWLQTGDIGRFYGGVFSIVGRRKEIFKTSLGEYIVPEKLESLYIGGIISDIFITGSKYSDHIAAISVCPDTTKTVADVRSHIESLGKKLFENSLVTKYEIPTRVIVIREPFETFKNGDFVTPTAKKRRQVIEGYFKDEIEAILQSK